MGNEIFKEYLMGNEILTAIPIKILPTKPGSVIFIISRPGKTDGCEWAMRTSCGGHLQWVTSNNTYLDEETIGDDWLPVTVDVEGMSPWEVELLEDCTHHHGGGGCCVYGACIGACGTLPEVLFWL